MRCFLSMILVLAAVPVHASDARRGPLRLMSYNLNFANPSFGASLDAITAGDADVVLLQEVTERWRDELVERFHTIYPHRAFRIHARMAGGLAVLSKLPLASEELWD